MLEIVNKAKASNYLGSDYIVLTFSSVRKPASLPLTSDNRIRVSGDSFRGTTMNALASTYSPVDFEDKLRQGISVEHIIE